MSAFGSGRASHYGHTLKQYSGQRRISLAHPSSRVAGALASISPVVAAATSKQKDSNDDQYNQCAGAHDFAFLSGSLRGALLWAGNPALTLRTR
jgi:hypothetical protein